MPEYTYRREDGTTFTIRQKFSETPLALDPATGQKVVRLVQPAGIIFKGSGFYVNDSRGSKQSLNGNGKHSDTSATSSENTSSASATTTESSSASKAAAAD